MCKHSLHPAGILSGCRCGDDLFAHEVPQLSARRLHFFGGAIPPAGSFGTRHYPVVIAQHLEVAADGGLGELEDGSELVDGELMPLEDEQHAAARRVGESRHAVENRRGR